MTTAGRLLTKPGAQVLALPFRNYRDLRAMLQGQPYLCIDTYTTLGLDADAPPR